MNAHRTIEHDTYRVTVNPGKNLRLYENPHLRNTPGLLDLGSPITARSFQATLTDDGWFVNEDLGGLPVSKTPGLRSLEDAWDFELVEIERLEHGTYVPIDDLGAI